MKYWPHILFWSLLPLLVAGCGKTNKSQQLNKTLLARVGSSYLTRKEAKKAIPDYIFQFDSIRALKNYRSQWVDQQLALKKARELDLPSHEKVQKRLMKARREVLLGALKRLIISKHKKEISISDSEALKYYHTYHKNFILGERFIKFRQIATHRFSAAQKARTELQEDSSWIEVVYKYSLNPDKMVKQSTKYWPVSAVLSDLPYMQQYAARLDSGEISPIRRSHGIFRFIQLTDVLEKGDRGDPHWFIKQLKEWRLLEKQKNYYKTYLKKLYFEAKDDDEIELFNFNHN